MSRGHGELRFAQGALFLAATGTAGLLWAGSEWAGTVAFVAILGFALVSEPCPLQFKQVRVNGAFMGVVLAAVVLGPGPATLIGTLTMVSNAIRRRAGWAEILPNISTYAAVPLAAGVAFELIGGPGLLHSGNLLLIPAVVGVFLLANVLNFTLIAVDIAVVDRVGLVRNFRTVYADIAPVEFAVGVLTAGVAFSYAAYGRGALVLLALVSIAFQYLMRIALRAVDRGEQLDERNRQLASLQVGLISTMVKTLSLRDHMTARHSAAVARYAREIAIELELSEREVDIIHTAALFHDIGKFIFPDSILSADRRLSDADYAIVRRHPEVGAELIAEIDGYGPVAEIVRSHHERMDGRGYPDALPADQIPLGSRIIAVADVYDVLTARDTYRQPVSSAEAIAELHRSAGTQLDPRIVETFVTVVQTRGIAFRHWTEADFEAELALERRVRDYAAPRRAA